MKTQQSNSSRRDDLGQLISWAERELGAFLDVVVNSFGAEQARLAAEDWFEELELVVSRAGD